MPTYTLEDRETGEQHEVVLSYGEMQEYKKIHNLKQIIQAVNIVSGARVSTRKLGGFKEVLQKVGEGHPGSYVDRTHNRRTAKQVKTAAIYKKHQDKKK
jgi:predicted nucleic acid-binding Zn ribbon protein